MKIVVDAMGGDYARADVAGKVGEDVEVDVSNAPATVTAGVVDAVNEFPVDITLVGIKDQIEKELSRYAYPKDRITIVHAPEVVDMDDNPLDVIRRKKGSSIAVGVNLLKEPGYDAFVSAGNTGALVAAATFYLRMIEGVDRPGIGIVIPQIDGFTFLIDVGANPDPKPEHIYQYGHMARVYMQSVIGVENPTVGLVNIGEEEGKGSGFDKQTYQLLQEKMPRFVGNVEPNKLFRSGVDCLVCSGIVGNVIIKLSEGLLEAAGVVLKRQIKKDPLAMFGGLLMQGSLKKLKKQVDYSEYGGAPLLGINGVVMKSHGRSSPKAIKNAIRAAMREVEHRIIDKLRAAVIS